MPIQLQARFYSDVLLNAIKRGYKDLLVDAINSAKKIIFNLFNWKNF